MSALQIETDSQNTHMLLGGLLLCVQDSVNFEESDSASDGQSNSARETNLLSSGEHFAFGSFTFLIISSGQNLSFQLSNFLMHFYIFFL